MTHQPDSRLPTDAHAPAPASRTHLHVTGPGVKLQKQHYNSTEKACAWYTANKPARSLDSCYMHWMHNRAVLAAGLHHVF